MLRESVDVIVGSIKWNLLKIRDGISLSKVVLMLANENPEVDKYALLYLDDVIERKYADAAIIYVANETARNLAIYNLKTQYLVEIKKIHGSTMEQIYKRYCLNKMFRNLFWTYIDHTESNLLGKFMRETEINAKDVVCLAIYNLRRVPED